MLPETGLERPRVIPPVVPGSQLPQASAHESVDAEAHAQALRDFMCDGSEGALSDETLKALELAGLDWDIIEMRFQEQLARSELDELFASGELACLWG
jgi:hypothetical protein